MNWVAELKTAAGQPMPKQDWEFTADPELAATAFADFRFDWLDVPALIRGAHEVFQYPMVDRDPLPSVDVRPDHPSRRCRASDVSRRVERCLPGDRRCPRARSSPRDGTDVDSGLARYEEIRRPLTSQIVLANRNVGPERMMELAEERAPDGFRDIHDVVTEAEMLEISSSYKRIGRLRCGRSQRAAQLSVS